MNTKDFTEKCRDLQGSYRERLGEPRGVGPHLKNGKPQVNMLVDGEKTGKNFVNDFTFNYAKRRVENKQPHETIDEYRLFNNMLSSQPMAFNLFCPFIQMLEQGKAEVVSRIFQNIFPDKHIGEVTEVGLEYLHTDIKNYLNDLTAMDAIVRYKDTESKPAFIAIETKYTDVLNEKTSRRRNVEYDKWIKQLGMFKPDTEAELIKSALAAKDPKKSLDRMKIVTQIYRNFLLTECYGVKEGANRCYSVVLSPAEHPTTEHEVASLRDELKTEYQYKISSISLEDFIARTLEVCPNEEKAPFEYFKDRYL